MPDFSTPQNAKKPISEGISPAMIPRNHPLDSLKSHNFDPGSPFANTDGIKISGWLAHLCRGSVERPESLKKIINP
jgi:hypothetical protein